MEGWKIIEKCNKCGAEIEHKIPLSIDETFTWCDNCNTYYSRTLFIRKSIAKKEGEETCPILFKTTKNILDRQVKVLQNADGSITLSENTIFELDEYKYLRITVSTVRRTEDYTVKEYIDRELQEQREQKQKTS